jgi:hypothetical protein
MFVENVGQFAEGARFQARDGQGALWLADDAIWLTLLEPAANAQASRRPDAANPMGRAAMPDALGGVNIRLTFADAELAPALEAFAPSSTTVSYFLGDNPQEWRPDAPVWGGVRYRELYPGLDLEVSGEATQPAMRLVCRVGDCRSALESVQLQVEGADEVALEGGWLRFSTTAGDFRLPLLRVADVAGKAIDSDGLSATISGNTITTPLVPAASALMPLPASPFGGELVYSTYLGGNETDIITGMAVDAAGNATVMGSTYSLDFPTTPGAFSQNHNGGFWDAFVSRLSPDGSSLIYSTYLGGDWFDDGGDVAVDAAGNATVTGNTSSTNFPTTPGAYDTSLNSLDGSSDAFVVRLNSDGSDLIYGTYLGGSSFDYAFDGLALGGDGSAYVANFTESADFPTTPGAYDTSHNGLSDTYVARLSADGGALIYSTFLGGSDGEQASSADVAADGSVTIGGATLSSDFPTTPGAFDTSYNGNGVADAFVARLSADGSSLDYGTFLGGSGGDWGDSLSVDEAGNMTIVGDTQSTDFPTTPGAFDTSFNGTYDAFAARLNAEGSDLLFSTFLGGEGDDYGLDIVVDTAGNTSVAGHTYSADFPISPNAFDATHNGSGDAFITRLSADGSNIQHSTLIGGTDYDGANDLAVHSDQLATISGSTFSADFPTTVGAFDTTYNSPGWADGFVTRITVETAIDFTISATPPAAEVCAGSDALWEVTIGSFGGYDQPVSLEAEGIPDPPGVAGFDPNNQPAPYNSILTVGTSGAAAGSYAIGVTGIGPTATHSVTVGLDVVPGVPAVTMLLAPTDGAAVQPLQPTLEWEPVAGADQFDVEVATDATFTNVVESATVGEASYMVQTPLQMGASYFWRVRADNVCGDGPWSNAWSFITVSASCPANTTTISVYLEEFEAGAPGWTHYALTPPDTWAFDNTRPGSGSGGFAYQADDLSSPADQALESPNVLLPDAFTQLTMQFYNEQDFEDLAGSGGCWDGGILEISTDGGGSWYQLDAELLTDPYNGVGENGPPEGMRMWCGETGGFQPWLNSIVDVAAFGGETVRFRWRMLSDASVGAPGWWIDDMEIVACTDEVTNVTLAGFDAATSPALWPAALLVSAIGVLLFAVTQRARRKV